VDITVNGKLIADEAVVLDIIDGLYSEH